MADWSNFFVAQAGASAALAGLIFVGISINLADLMRIPSVLLRAAGALVLLMAVLAISSFLLVPHQSERRVGWEVLIIGLLAWSLSTALGIRAVQRVEAQYRQGNILAVALRQIATVPIVIAGIAILLAGEGGLQILPVSFVASFVVALVDAWVILVEIQR